MHRTQAVHRRLPSGTTSSESVAENMYALHIDAKCRRVVTTWGPTVTDGALMDYQREVWRDPAVRGFDELIDFRAVENIDVSTAGLEAVAALASSMDDAAQKSRFAIVVGSNLSYGLSRMYESFRSLNESSVREVEVFRNMDEALAWLDAPH